MQTLESCLILSRVFVHVAQQYLTGKMLTGSLCSSPVNVTFVGSVFVYTFHCKAELIRLLDSLPSRVWQDTDLLQQGCCIIVCLQTVLWNFQIFTIHKQANLHGKQRCRKTMFHSPLFACHTVSMSLSFISSTKLSYLSCYLLWQNHITHIIIVKYCSIV